MSEHTPPTNMEETLAALSTRISDLLRINELYRKALEDLVARCESFIGHPIAYDNGLKAARAALKEAKR